jgi:hypothetical protein
VTSNKLRSFCCFTSTEGNSPRDHRLPEQERSDTWIRSHKQCPLLAVRMQRDCCSCCRDCH